MTKKFNLSDKINDGANTDGWHKVIYIEDIKEFIRRLREYVNIEVESNFGTDKKLLKFIDKLVGDKIIGDL